MRKLNSSMRYTNDFKSMIRIVTLNSLGFFFLDFIIPYIASQKLNATGVQIGLIFSVQVIGIMISSLFVGFLTDKVKSRMKYSRDYWTYIVLITYIYNQKRRIRDTIGPRK